MNLTNGRFKSSFEYACGFYFTVKSIKLYKITVQKSLKSLILSKLGFEK